MDFNPRLTALPGGDDLIPTLEVVLKKMSEDQLNSYELEQALKSGHLSRKLHNMKCGPLPHARWLTTGQRISFF